MKQHRNSTRPEDTDMERSPLTDTDAALAQSLQALSLTVGISVNTDLPFDVAALALKRAIQPFIGLLVMPDDIDAAIDRRAQHLGRIDAQLSALETA